MSSRPTGAIGVKRKTKPIKDVQDALSLAGQVLYKAMYGAPDGAKSKTCTKGYRQLAAETHLDKDTVRDLISEFKGKGIIRETRTYDPDTRSAKTYEVFPIKPSSKCGEMSALCSSQPDANDQRFVLR